ncbi:MAG: hypothetical protein CVT92_15490 [Bacteroidetes bacterium HGW-Bacteroidetes-1]|nr:MAG: hypothetical protein CVT92_15490 [Bacteroidetes bacterium HGW-Bacteroidetes-1]
MVFVYGNLIYLKNPESNEFLFEALSKNYWRKSSSKYFVMITQNNDSTIDNLFEFILKIKNGFDNYSPKADEFEHFFIGFHDHTAQEIPTPIQMVAFFNELDKNRYVIENNFTQSSIKNIRFSEEGTLKVKSIANSKSDVLTCKSCIGHTLVFSNDLMRQTKEIEKQIIGFKIPILTDSKQPYEVLKEFDRLRDKVTYHKFSELLECCMPCKNIYSEICRNNFNQLLKNNFNCENKSK